MKKQAVEKEKKAKVEVTGRVAASNILKRSMIEAMEKSLGIVKTACEQVGIARISHYRWMNEDPEYREAIENTANIVLDFAESQLYKRMREGSDASIIFFLKCRGKSRGYIEKQEVDHTGEIKISVAEKRIS